MSEPAPPKLSLKYREMIRHSLTVLLFPKYKSYETQNQAKQIFGMFMKDKAESFGRIMVFRKFYQ